MHRRELVLTVAGVLVVVLAVGGWLGWRSQQRSDYEQALAWLPAPTLRATYTDWAGVRRLADGSVGSSPSSVDVDAFTSRAYDLDLTSTSAVVDATYAMAEKYGFSPLDAAWEMYGQSREGAVVVMHVGESVDLDEVTDNLRSLGYPAPDDRAESGGVWAGDDDLVATIDPSLSPVMKNVAVLADERVVLMSDDAGYADTAVAAVTGSEEVLLDEDGVSALGAVATSDEGPVSAVLLASDFTCEALSTAEADEEDQARAEELVAEAGGVSPLAGLVMARYDDRSMVVGMHFENDEQAEDNLRPRTELARGEAVGQGGTFAERFSVEEARADGERVVLELTPVREDEPLLSDLSQGPVLFATC